MTAFQAVVLGVLQGLGEFLPISSSGHLIVVPWFLGWPDHGLAFDVALHSGTLVAVLAAFAGDWISMAGDFLKGARAGRPFATPGGSLLGRLIVASVPGAVAGALLEHWADSTFRSPALVAVTMAIMGFVLFIADRRAGRGGTAAVTMKDAIVIGCAQALALVPGVSRSGATISAALFLGYRREEAARFSFLLATPITAGAALRKLPALLGSPERALALLGMVAAGVVGLAAIRFLLAHVRTRDYTVFVYYRWLFSAVVAIFYLVRR